MTDAHLLRVPEVAAMLGGIDEDTVYALCNLPDDAPLRLRHIQGVGRLKLVPIEEVHAWIKRNTA